MHVTEQSEPSTRERTATPLVGPIVPFSNPTIEALLNRIGVAAVLGVHLVTTWLQVLCIGAAPDASAQPAGGSEAGYRQTQARVGGAA
jgi:hypothetical protein